MIIINGFYYICLFFGAVVTIAGGTILCFDIVGRLVVILMKNLRCWYLFIEFLSHRKAFKMWLEKQPKP